MTGYPSQDKVHLQEYSERELNPLVYPWSMYHTFTIWNKGHMDEPCIMDGYGKEYSKQELKQEIKKIVKALLSWGVSGDNGSVAIVALPNGFRASAVIMALNAIGVKVFLLDYSDPGTARHEFWAREADILFYCTNYPTVESARSEKKVSYHGFLLYGASKSDEECESKIIKYACYNDEPLVFLQTSGSTSEPKVLPFRNSAIYAAMVFALNSTHIDNHDPEHRKLMTLLSVRLPFGFMTGFLPILWGQEVVYASGVTPECIARYHEYGASLIFGTPTLLSAMMALTPEDADLSPLIGFYSSGFATPEDMFPKAKVFFLAHGSHAELRNNYGFGEGLGIGTASDHVKHIAGTSGKFYRGPKWLVVDDELNEVKYGEVGELVVSSRTLCDGYLDNESATKEVFVKINDETYFRTGDIGSVDTQGYVRIVGRKKRFYQPLGAGDKVSCDLVEKALSGLSFVHQAAVVPVPDDTLVTAGKAFVVLEKGVDGFDVEARVLGELSGILQDFQLPKTVVELSAIPMMSSGKPDYQRLQKM